MTLIRFVSICFLLLASNAHGQQKYQSLMWQVSGNGLKSPSYLYGTMHISGRLAFQLGDPFYDALESVDVVALELEPDAWLEAIFQDPTAQYWGMYGHSDEDYYYDEEASDSPLPALRGFFSLNTNLDQRLKDALLYDPALLNYLLFRMGDDSQSLDYAEDTWLDMHIYQTGKKLGKQTIGLETYEQSDEFMRKAGLEEAMQEDTREWDEGDIAELDLLQMQLEPAYRNQDLDLIDSLTRITSSAAFRKYILEERNKVFIHSIDSVLRVGKSLFAAMGCAHLPGENGVIEILRSMGYRVDPVQKGMRNAKRRKEFDERTFNREFTTHTTADGQLKFQTPTKVYQLDAMSSATSWIALDIANGASYTVMRLKSYSSVSGFSNDDVLGLIEGMLYETIAGEIVSNEKIRVGKYPGIDVTSRTRRGDYQRYRIVVLPEEVLVMKLSAPGSKVRQGFGSPFFEKLEVATVESEAQPWQAPDGSCSAIMPGHRVFYRHEIERLRDADLEVVSGGLDENYYYLLQRHIIDDPGFLDEDRYELERLLRAYCDDRQLRIESTEFTSVQGLPALDAKLSDGKNPVQVRFIIQGLNYYAAATNDLDSLRSAEFFASLHCEMPSHSSFSTHRNEELFFSVDLPYVPQASVLSAEMLFFNPEPVADPNSPFGTNAAYVLNPPGESAQVVVDFQRYHEFSDGEDTASFVREKREMVLGVDMQMLQSNEQWTSDGAVLSYTVGDTSCTRRYMHRMLLHNKSMYHLTATYDSVLGPGDFVQRVFDSFQSTDTIFPYPHFDCRDGAYLDALLSSDSVMRRKAVEITSEMDFSGSSGGRIRYALAHLNGYDFNEEQLIRNKLIYGLASDTSAANVEFITKEFNSFADSAQYQLDLLTVLLQIKTKSAWQAYGSLVVEEPPIVFDEMGGSGCELLFDSVRLATPLIPKLMQLLAIDEYEESIYHLMAAAADSGWLKPPVYRLYVPQLLVEARNELKRLNASLEGGYAFNSDVLMDYCALLQPLRKEKDVEAFFKKVYSSKKQGLVLDMIAFDFAHNMTVSDSVLAKVARNREYVHELYRLLHKEKQVERMPAPYRTREEMIDVYLKMTDDEESNLVDSISVVSSFAKSIRGLPIQVYYCKTHMKKSNQWLGKVLAFDARDQSDIWPMFLESDRNIVLDTNENAMEEFEKEFLYMEEQNREYVNFGSGGSDFNVQWY
jgi:uncharacterized protein YbaP (TraB family)